VTLVAGEEEAGRPRAGDQRAERAELPARRQRLAQRGEHRERGGLQVVAERRAEPVGVPGPKRRHQLRAELRFADRRIAAKPVKRAVHGRGGQRAVGQREHPVVGHGRDERLGELLAPAAPDGGAAEDGEGHVAADPAGDLAQVLLRQLGLPERVAGDERGGGVRATARKTAGDRYPFADRDGYSPPPVPARVGCHSVPDRDRLAERPHGAQRQVVAVCGHKVGALACHGHAVRLGGHDGHLVEQRDGMEDRHQTVIAIGPQRPHGELEVDLRRHPRGHTRHSHRSLPAPSGHGWPGRCARSRRRGGTRRGRPGPHRRRAAAVPPPRAIPPSRQAQRAVSCGAGRTRHR
jgi:hypothetical protein